MAFTQAPQQVAGAIQNGRDYLDGLVNGNPLGKFLLKPSDSGSIGDFLFDYEGETNVTLQADITDHFAENNQFLNDHYALKPVRITLRGYVGELVQKKANGISGLLAALQNKLTAVPAYIGKYTPQALGKIQAALTKAQSTVNKVNNVLSKVQSVAGLFPGAVAAPTKQAQGYLKLETLMLTKQIFSVQTPYKLFQSMAIESLSITQDETTKYISDVTVTLKQMRFADVLLTTSSAGAFAGRTRFQRGDQADQGLTKGKPALISTLKSAFGGA